MIKAIVRKTYLPIQIIFDAILHQRRQRLMMSYALKIHPNLNYCASMNNHAKRSGKRNNLARTRINGA